MTTVRSYDDLRLETSEWLSREGDPLYESTFDLMVQLAETRIRKALKTRQLQVTRTIDLTAGSLTAPLPADFIGVRGSPALLAEEGRRNLDYISDALPGRSQIIREPGRPDRFYIYGTNIVTVPRPDINYQIELPMYAQLLALTEDIQTNWLLDKFPDTYFNGVMWYAYLWLEDFARASTWSDKFFSSLRDLRRIDKHDRFSVSGGRSRSQIVPVDVPLTRTGRAF